MLASTRIWKPFSNDKAQISDFAVEGRQTHEGRLLPRFSFRPCVGRLGATRDKPIPNVCVPGLGSRFRTFLGSHQPKDYDAAAIVTGR